MMSRLLTVLLFFIPAKLLSQTSYVHYNSNDGLAQSQVLNLMQCSKGYIWAGTKGGLSRFDGLKFKNYTIKDGIKGNQIYSIFETKEGAIWISTRYGLHEKKGEKFIFKKPPSGYKFGNSFYAEGKIYINAYSDSVDNDKIPMVFVFENSKYKVIYRNRQVIKLSGNPLLLEYAEDNKSAYLYDKNNKLIMKFQKNAMYFSGDNMFVSNNKVYKFINKKFTEIGKIQGKTKASEFFCTESNSEIIFINIDQTATVYKPERIENGKIIYKETTDKLNQIEQIDCILTDDENNKWIGTENGLYRITNFTNYTEKNGIPELVWSITEDYQKNIWFGSYNSKEFPLKYYNYETDKFYFPTENQKKIIKEIATDKRKLTEIRISFGSIKLSDGNTLFSCTFSNPIIFGKNKTEEISPETNINNTYCLFEDTSTNTIYGGSLNNLFKIKNEKAYLIPIYEKNKFGLALDIERGKDNKLYIASLGGITVLDEDEKHIKFWQNDSIPPYGNISVCKDFRGNLWFGSVNGLFFYDYKNFKKIYHPELQTLVTSIEQLKDSTLIAGSVRGIALLDLNEFYKKNDTTFRFYDKSAGFFGNEVNQNCIFQDSHQNVWVATADNVVMFNPNDLTKSKSTPKLYIEKVFAFDKEFNYTELTKSQSKINHNYVNITINFTGIYHKAPEQVLFKYELSGYDKTASPISKNRSITYTNLPSGKYTFKLWACNESGLWTNKPLEYTFEIVPAFWQTLLFKILSVLIFIFILIYALRQYYKEKQKRKIKLIKTKIEAQENERNRLAKDLHDGIAGSLTGIKINIENIKNSKKYENLQFIIDDLQNIQTEVRTISHNLHSPMFAVSNVEEILRADIEKLNKSENFSINFNVFPKIDWNKIKTDIQQQMYLIVKEGIANTIKHAEATETEIQIVLDKNIFRISVEDNGKGFDSEKIQRGLGITNLVSRVEALKGKIQLNSAVNNGTSINIEIPIS